MNNYCIISHTYKFVYIPIPKVACTSLLNRVAEIIHGLKTKNFITSSHRDVHTRRKEVFDTKDSEIRYNAYEAIRTHKDYFKFAFVRNPFERIHSCYIDKLSMHTYGFDNNLIKRYPQMYRGMRFAEFLHCVQTIPLEEMDEHFRPQYSFFPIKLVDFIGRFERIGEDWNKIENILGTTAKPLYIYNKTQEIDCYDGESEKLVQDIYEKDFEMFQYNKIREKKPLPDRKLPILITADTHDKVYPFKDIFIEYATDGIDVTVTGNDPIIIIPYFSISKGKSVVFAIDIFAEVETRLTVFYTGEDDWDKPQSRSFSASLHKGDNHLVFTLDDDDLAGRFRLQISKKPGKFRLKKILITEQTYPWLEDPIDLTETTQKIFSLPPHAQKHKNLSSMCNYASIYIPILDALRPRNICEIGCDQGENTRVLIDYCEKKSARLTIVDPSELDPALLKFSDSVMHVRKKSLEFLENIEAPDDVYFIDGDHNYVTVFGELQLIDKLASHSNFPTCILIHDISWPWAYRDLFYAPEELDISDLHNTSEKGVSLYSVEPTEDGLPNLGKYVISTAEGGKKNGVLKAIEDFLEKRKWWSFIGIPSIYGLGMLWTSEKLSESQKNCFDEAKKHFSYFKEFLSILEWNRLALYSQIIRNARTWRRDQKYIKELEAKLAKTYSHKERFRKMLNVLKSK